MLGPQVAVAVAYEPEPALAAASSARREAGHRVRQRRGVVDVSAEESPSVAKFSPSIASSAGTARSGRGGRSRVGVKLRQPAADRAHLGLAGGSSASRCSSVQRSS